MTFVIDVFLSSIKKLVRNKFDFYVCEAYISALCDHTYALHYEYTNAYNSGIYSYNKLLKYKKELS